MGCPDELRPEMSVTDLAYAILKQRGKAAHFKELSSEILKIKPMGKENPGRVLAQIHTEINLDSRFIHLGNGEWGLRDWQPRGGTKVVRIRPEPAAKARPRRAILPDEEEENLSDTAEEEDEDLLDEVEDGETPEILDLGDDLDDDDSDLDSDLDEEEEEKD